MQKTQPIPLIERETIITYNEAEKTANVYTMNKALGVKLNGMAKEYPTLVKFVKEYPDGALEYTVPKKSIRVNKPIVLTDEQREKRRKLMCAAREA